MSAQLLSKDVHSGDKPAHFLLSHSLYLILSRFSFLFLMLVMLPSLALAKRAGPEKVEPVVIEGVRFVAPNIDGKRAMIEAWDTKTDKKLWDLVVFTNPIDPKLEADVQWVFIKKMKSQDGFLIVTSERGKAYRVDVKKKEVTPVE